MSSKPLNDNSNLITVVVQIGNSDDRLTQKEWSRYVDKVRRVTKEYTKEMHFNGSSNTADPWQNACFVFEIEDKIYSSLYSELRSIRKHYKQDSIAIMRGYTEFV